MAKERKSRQGLEALILEAAAKSGKCDDLEAICIAGPIPPSFGDWALDAFRPKRDCLGLSFECQSELARIVSRLQRHYDLESD